MIENNFEQYKNKFSLLWENALNEVNTLEDKLGTRVDEGIKETIAIFWLYNISTAGSCEGHLFRENNIPYVDIVAVGEPKERFNNESKIKTIIAKKFNTSSGSIDFEENNEANDEYWNMITKEGETEEYIEFRKENTILKEKVSKLINEFYSNRKTANEFKLKLIDIGPSGLFRIYNGDLDSDSFDFGGSNEKEKFIAINTFKKRQQEMKDFTEFLKKKFIFSIQ